MKTRPAAEAWYKEKYGCIGENIRSSKLYAPEESMTNKYAWWIEVEARKLKAGEFQNILLRKGAGNDDFFHLKIPNCFLIDNKHNLGCRQDKKDKEVFSLIISAEPHTEIIENSHKLKFIETRGNGQISLQKFCEAEL